MSQQSSVSIPEVRAKPPEWRAGYVYILQDADLYKIGTSIQPGFRSKCLGFSPEDIVHVIESDDGYWLEKKLHARYAAKRVHGEWFRLSQEDIAELCAIERMDCPPEKIAHTYHSEQRIDVKVNAALKAAIIAECGRRGMTMNDWITEAACAALGIGRDGMAVPRKMPGRKPKQPPAPARKERKK